MSNFSIQQGPSGISFVNLSTGQQINPHKSIPPQMESSAAKTSSTAHPESANPSKISVRIKKWFSSLTSGFKGLGASSSTKTSSLKVPSSVDSRQAALLRTAPQRSKAEQQQHLTDLKEAALTGGKEHPIWRENNFFTSAFDYSPEERKTMPPRAKELFEAVCAVRKDPNWDGSSEKIEEAVDKVIGKNSFLLARRDKIILMAHKAQFWPSTP
jgi:hypothetical protein